MNMLTFVARTSDLSVSIALEFVLMPQIVKYKVQTPSAYRNSINKGVWKFSQECGPLGHCY